MNQKKKDTKDVQDAISRYELLSRMKTEVARARQLLANHNEAMANMTALSFIEMNTNRKTPPTTSVGTQGDQKSSLSSGKSSTGKSTVAAYVPTSSGKSSSRTVPAGTAAGGAIASSSTGIAINTKIAALTPNVRATSPLQTPTSVRISLPPVSNSPMANSNQATAETKKTPLELRIEAARGTQQQRKSLNSASNAAAPSSVSLSSSNTGLSSHMSMKKI